MFVAEVVVKYVLLLRTEFFAFSESDLRDNHYFAQKKEKVGLDFVSILSSFTTTSCAHTVMIDNGQNNAYTTTSHEYIHLDYTFL
jgi:hypothetical protein